MSGLWNKILADVMFIGSSPPCPGPYFAYCDYVGLPFCSVAPSGSMEWYGTNPLSGFLINYACAVCANDGSCLFCGNVSLHITTDCYSSSNPYVYSGNLCCGSSHPNPCSPPYCG